ncbi:MAG: DUF192 domain-containing protein [Candidatus Sericytochromatia bacterium]
MGREREQTEMLIGTQALVVDVAWLLEDKRRGLSGHAPLTDTQGLLFVFDPPEYAGVGMAEMDMAISVGFISPSGHLLSLHDLSPGDPLLIPAQPVRAFLEVAWGWFARHELQAGVEVQIPELHRWIHPPRQIGFRLT